VRADAFESRSHSPGVSCFLIFIPSGQCRKNLDGSIDRKKKFLCHPIRTDFRVVNVAKERKQADGVTWREAPDVTLFDIG
jgi:hypothetical protein